MKHAWHALFAPLPDDAVVKRTAVLPPELVDRPESEAVAGWETLSVELSAGAAGLRHAMVVLDASGTPISAGDWVMYCSGQPIEYVHENVGGRLQPDGSFLGTRWRSIAIDVPGSDEAETKETIQCEPTEEDVVNLKRLVEELLRRAPKA